MNGKAVDWVFDASEYSQAVYAGTDRAFDRLSRQRGLSRYEWQSAFREAISEALGLHVMAAVGGPGQDFGRVSDDELGFRRETIEVISESSVVIPCTLLLPRTEVPPGGFPWILGLHGHHPRGKAPWAGIYANAQEQAEVEDAGENVAIQAVRRGYAALIPELRGFGHLARLEDVEAGEKNSCHDLSRRALLLGRTLMGERVYDTRQVLDYALSRGDLNPHQWNLLGFSGGGTVAMYLAALDDRVRRVILASSFCTYRDSILSRSHCPCNVVPGILRLGEMADVAGLISPRRLSVIHGRNDAIYPMDGTLEAFSGLHEIYALDQEGDRCRLYAVEGRHQFLAEAVWTAIAEQAGEVDVQDGTLGV